MIGSRLSHFEITAKLGEGGMGEVYLAEDTRLGRRVAIKVLPEAFVADPERLARFEREARVLASLSHPNVAAIHEVGEENGTHFLVMELAAGEDLSERLARGAVRVDEAIAIALQIAEALEAAHERGIVHRDLKPANVKIDADGQVKVLDFGLAKALEAEPAARGTVDLTRSPTLTDHGTRLGVLLGTAAYMSPEQARGKPADKRADIWAFGVVLWEMLAGERLFAGETVSDTLAAILRADLDEARLPASVPAALRRLVSRCLRRDPRQRLHDIADVRILLDEAVEPSPVETVPSPPGRRWPVALGWLVAAVALAVAATLGWRAATPQAAPAVTRFAVQPPSDVRLGLRDMPALALSSDGRKLAFSGIEPQSGQPMIYLRRMEEPDARPVRGTERGFLPFFSPAGDTLGFFADSQLRTIPVEGGSAFPLAATPATRGGAWSPDGSTIYFSPDYASGIWRIPARGGTAELVVEPDTEAGERTFRWPQVLPGGRAVLYTVGASDSPNFYDEATLEAFSLAGGTRHVLVRGANMGRFVPPDLLVYARSGVLYVARLDPDRLELVGRPSPMLQGVGGDPSSGAGYFDLAADGTLAFVRGELSNRSVYLSLIDRQGEAQRLPLEPRGFSYPRFSPDGRRLAFSVGVSPAAIQGDVWVYTLADGVLERLTFSESAVYPSWTPDGSRIAYMETQELGVFLQAAAGGGASELVMKDGSEPLVPESWSPDGRTLAYTQVGRSTDVYLRSADGAPRLFERDASGPVFSPDGRWIAYASPASGATEVFVRPVSGDGKWQISTGGGAYARWPSPGNEIYFIGTGVSDRPILSVEVEEGPGFRARPPRQIVASTGTSVTFTAPYVNWDVAPGGQQFVFTELEHGVAADAVEVALSWARQLGTPDR